MGCNHPYHAYHVNETALFLRILSVPKCVPKVPVMSIRCRTPEGTIVNGSVFGRGTRRRRRGWSFMIGLAFEKQFEQFLVFVGERFIAGFGCQRASLLGGGDGVRKTASLGVSSGERPHHDCAMVIG